MSERSIEGRREKARGRRKDWRKYLVSEGYYYNEIKCILLNKIW
jgi:hypothetical protein